MKYGLAPLKVPVARPTLWKAWAAVQEFVAVAGDGAALATRDVLGILKTETSQVAEGAAFAAFVFGQPGLTGVLDDGEVMFAGNRVDRFHVARHAVNVHRQDGARAFGDPAFD